MITQAAGQVRGLSAPNYAEGTDTQPVHINNRGEQIVAQGLPGLTELVRMGNSWQLATVTGQAALTALPTTVAGLSIYNNEPGGGKCYAVDSFGSWEAVVDATQTDVTAIFAMLNRASSIPTAPTDTLSSSIKSLSGRGAYGGRAKAGPGLTVVNDGWFPHATAGQMAAAAAGANWKVNEVQCQGLYLIQPGCQYNIQAVKAAAAAAAQQFFFVRLHEVQLIYVP